MIPQCIEWSLIHCTNWRIRRHECITVVNIIFWHYILSKIKSIELHQKGLRLVPKNAAWESCSIGEQYITQHDILQYYIYAEIFRLIDNDSNRWDEDHLFYSKANFMTDRQAVAQMDRWCHTLHVKQIYKNNDAK